MKPQAERPLWLAFSLNSPALVSPGNTPSCSRTVSPPCGSSPRLTPSLLCDPPPSFSWGTSLLLQRFETQQEAHTALTTSSLSLTNGLKQKHALINNQREVCLRVCVRGACITLVSFLPFYGSKTLLVISYASEISRKIVFFYSLVFLLVFFVLGPVMKVCRVPTWCNPGFGYNWWLLTFQIVWVAAKYFGAHTW